MTRWLSFNTEQCEQGFFDNGIEFAADRKKVCNVLTSRVTPRHSIRR